MNVSHWECERGLLDPAEAQEIREAAAPYIRAAELWDSIDLPKGTQP